MKPQPTTSEKWVWFWQGVALAGLCLSMWFIGGMPLEAKAQMFPSDAITIARDMHTGTAALQVFATSTEDRTIWSVTGSCDNVGDIAVYIGPFTPQPTSKNLIDTEGVVNGMTVNQARHWPSNTDIWITKVGQSQCFVWLTYSPRVASTTNATTTGAIAAQGGFSYGEILISFLLLLVFSLLFFSELRNMIFKNGVVVRVIKEYDRKG